MVRPLWTRLLQPNAALLLIEDELPEEGVPRHPLCSALARHLQPPSELKSDMDDACLAARFVWLWTVRFAWELSPKGGVRARR